MISKKLVDMYEDFNIKAFGLKLLKKAENYKPKNRVVKAITDIAGAFGFLSLLVPAMGVHTVASIFIPSMQGGSGPGTINNAAGLGAALVGIAGLVTMGVVLIPAIVLSFFGIPILIGYPLCWFGGCFILAIVLTTVAKDN